MKDEIIAYAMENLEFTKEEAEDFIGMYAETLDEHCTNIRHALDTANFQELRSLTHSLIGCSGNIGALKIADGARELNTAAKAADIPAAEAVFVRILAMRDELRQN